MIRDFLCHRNPNKRVMARSNGWSIVELPDRVDASGVVYFRFAIARTDVKGNASTDDGIIMSLDDLLALPDMIAGAEIRASAPVKDYEAEHAEPAPDKPRFC